MKHKNKEYHFYILNEPDRASGYKVGITTNPTQRLKTYRTASPQSYFESLYRIGDKKHEKAIFYELSGAFRMDREVVYGPLSIIKNIIEGYLDEQDSCNSSVV